jgi:polysaccharide biosynthesis/export protein
MAGGPSVAIMRDIQTLFDTGTASGLSDRELLERFATRRDASAEAAFEALVLRHGPMVLRVCRNVLGDATDAQDAFQATFLVLVRRSSSIRRLESVGSWLYGVACRVAARARVEASRRRAAERHGALRVVTAVEPAEGMQSDPEEYGPLVQEEVRRLPDKYRAVVALCYWQGLTQEQAAVQLGCPLGTVRSRLARARDLLRRRLTRRGRPPLAGVVAAKLDPASSAISPVRLALVPQNLTISTVKAGAQVVAGRAMTEVTSTSVAALAQSVLRSLFMMKIKTIAVYMVLIGISVFGASLAAPQADSRKPSPVPGRGSRLKVDLDRSKSQPPIVTQGSYVVEPPDLLLVEVLEALPGRPISGERLVRPDGKISLGFYGDIYVAGLTLPEIKEKVIRRLQTFLHDEALGLVDIDPEKLQPKIDPKTKQPVAIDPKESDTVFVDVAKSKSKFCYVQGAFLVPGRLPLTGCETILDVVNLAGGLSPEANRKEVVLYRYEPKDGSLQAMPIEIDQITMGDDLSTNYQVKPGDRLVVPRLAEPKADAVESGAERSTPAPTSRQDISRSIDRQPEESHITFEKPAGRARRRVDRDDVASRDSATLYDVQKRLKDVEQKLDRILEVLKARTP